VVGSASLPVRLISPEWIRIGMSNQDIVVMGAWSERPKRSSSQIRSHIPPPGDWVARTLFVRESETHKLPKPWTNNVKAIRGIGEFATESQKWPRACSWTIHVTTFTADKMGNVPQSADRKWPAFRSRSSSAATVHRDNQSPESRMGQVWSERSEKTARSFKTALPDDRMLGNDRRLPGRILRRS
jgi:hypothetical protein